MTPLKKYQELIERGEFQSNSQQKQVIVILNKIYLELLPRFGQCKMFKKLYFWRKTPIKGLYLWGGVGVGKTWMMDIFYQCLPNKKKMRMHFHQFMLIIHQRLKYYRDASDPLKWIARDIANENIVICFDEFFVSDITDAMLLAGLFDALFRQGVTLIATSNVKPDNLYKDGISREQFLPAIELIKINTDVLHISLKKDYRLRELKKAGTFLTPFTKETSEKMQRYFESLTDTWSQNETLILLGRPVQTFRRGNGVIWFLFQDLCAMPRSQVDYLEIAKSYHTVFLSNVPKLKENQTNEAIYLINLVDVFYDANVKLIISAVCSIEEIYQEGLMKFEFERTKSRLIEMQTVEYLKKPHLY